MPSANARLCIPRVQSSFAQIYLYRKQASSLASLLIHRILKANYSHHQYCQDYTCSRNYSTERNVSRFLWYLHSHDVPISTLWFFTVCGKSFKGLENTLAHMFTLSLKQVVPLAKSLNSVGDVTEYIHKWKISSRKMKLFLFPEKFKRFVEC